MFGLAELLQRASRLTPEGADGFFEPAEEAFCSPGFWVCFTARARSRGLKSAGLNIPGNRAGYAQAIGIEAALGEADSYLYPRHQQGRNYSPLVVLDDVDRTDQATSAVNGCIRHLFPDVNMQQFVTELCDVVGDMHDNVWSHGESTGISMAQRWNKYGTGGEVQCIEFALADCGRGLLGELTRAGIAGRLGITDDESAIRWCIQKGHSSKLHGDGEWAQSLPQDIVGNPIGPDARVKPKENNHLGLGLYKLTQLVTGYGGELWLASGNAMLHIGRDGATTYNRVSCPWQGVALACRFATDVVLERVAMYKARPDELDRLLARLLGDRQ
jgi:hypothetical protein